MSCDSTTLSDIHIIHRKLHISCLGIEVFVAARRKLFVESKRRFIKPLKTTITINEFVSLSSFHPTAVLDGGTTSFSSDDDDETPPLGVNRWCGDLRNN